MKLQGTSKHKLIWLYCTMFQDYHTFGNTMVLWVTFCLSLRLFRGSWRWSTAPGCWWWTGSPMSSWSFTICHVRRIGRLRWALCPLAPQRRPPPAPPHETPPLLPTADRVQRAFSLIRWEDLLCECLHLCKWNIPLPSDCVIVFSGKHDTTWQVVTILYLCINTSLILETPWEEI